MFSYSFKFIIFTTKMDKVWENIQKVEEIMNPFALKCTKRWHLKLGISYDIIIILVFHALLEEREMFVITVAINLC